MANVADIVNEMGGVFTIEVLRDGKSGPEVIAKREVHNLVVNTGKRQIWRIGVGSSTSCFDQFRIGTSPAQANSGHTNVLSPVTGTINTADSKSLLSGTRTEQLVVSYLSGAGTKSATGISEVVILNQNTSPGGSALARGTFTAVNKTTSDKLKITYKVSIT